MSTIDSVSQLPYDRWSFDKDVWSRKWHALIVWMIEVMKDAKKTQHGDHEDIIS